MRVWFIYVVSYLFLFTFFRFALSAVIGNVFSAIFTVFFALVGTLLGAMTGALIGQETESGFVRKAAVRAISGAVFSIDGFESSLVLWQNDESGIGCLSYLVNHLSARPVDYVS